MTNMAKLPFELSVPISRARLKRHRGTRNVEYGPGWRLAGSYQVAGRDCTALRHPRPTCSIRERRGSVSSYGYYASLINRCYTSTWPPCPNPQARSHGRHASRSAAAVRRPTASKQCPESP
jgi:hypothetical protein